MLRASLTFFALALLSLGLGATELGGVSLETGRTLLFVFLGLAILTFLGGLLTNKNAAIKPRAKRISDEEGRFPV
jgi:hypothetical protein